MSRGKIWRSSTAGRRVAMIGCPHWRQTSSAAMSTAGGTPAALAAKWATQTIPIVFMGVGDPVGSGLVSGLARPGGNLTGISEMTTDLMSKRLELLFEMVPQATVIALLVNPNIAITEGVIREV